jgi:hypothetical protein
MAVLFTAQLDPSSPLFWLASLSVAMVALRMVLVLVLLLSFISVPEGSRPRTLIGLSVLSLGLWIMYATYEGRLGFIDFMTLTPAVIAVLGVLLETKPEDEPFRPLAVAATARDWLFGAAKPVVSRGMQLGWLVIMDFGLTVDYYSGSPAANLRRVQQYRELESPQSASSSWELDAYKTDDVRHIGLAGV